MMREQLIRIRLLLLDVDGVMTDGRIIYDDHGGETKAFDVRDGHGIKLLQRAGIRVGIITGRQSAVVQRRAEELGIELVYQGVKDKLVPLREIQQKTGFVLEEIAYAGDDVIDLPVLRRVGFAATVADAVDDVKPHVHYVTHANGGRGAVRELCDLLLKETGRWGEVTARYFAESH
jgi:3-deoxy-D-manno-octulosonate 8-phosphate phosphatase (KDO 8-P phosphatase)